MNCAGKAALITGGSSGIGLGIRKASINACMEVAVTYRTTGVCDAMRFSKMYKTVSTLSASMLLTAPDQFVSKTS